MLLPAAQIPAEQRDVVFDPRQDDFLVRHMYANYGEVGAAVRQLVEKFSTHSQQHKKVRGAAAQCWGTAVVRYCRWGLGPTGHPCSMPTVLLLDPACRDQMQPALRLRYIAACPSSVTQLGMALMKHSDIPHTAAPDKLACRRRWSPWWTCSAL